MNISFIGTGHYLPEIIQPNSQFKESEFIDENGKAFEAENTEIIEKFQAITGIESRRYLEPHLNTSDMGFFAAQRPLRTQEFLPKKLITSFFHTTLVMFVMEKFKPTSYLVWLLELKIN